MGGIAGSSNGRTSPFGGEYLGSNPSPAAMKIRDTISVLRIFILFLSWIRTREGVGEREFPVSEVIRNRGFRKSRLAAQE